MTRLDRDCAPAHSPARGVGELSDRPLHRPPQATPARPPPRSPPMNPYSRVGLTLLTGAGMALVAAPASAHPDGDHHDDVVVEVGEWTPAPAEFYEPFTFPACGTTIAMEGGDVRRAEIGRAHV